MLDSCTGLPYDGLSDTQFMLRCSRHITMVKILSISFHLERAAIDNLCALTRLRILELESHGPDHEPCEPLNAGISRLTLLEQLRLTFYAPHSIPIEISHLLCLTEVDLDFGGNADAVLTCRLPRLASVQIFDLQQPLIVPPTLDGLASLTKLVLQQLSLRASINAISQLVSLKRLVLSCLAHVHDRAMQALQAAIGGLTNLESLVLSSIDFAFELTRLSALSSLQALTVSHTHTHTAVCSAQWQHLRTLNLSNNKLAAFPRGWASLPCLEELNIAYQAANGDQELPLDGLIKCVAMPALKVVRLQQVSEWSPIALCHILEAELAGDSRGIAFEY